MKRKRVIVRSHGPLSVHPTATIGWEDVWLRVHSGRQLLKLAPTLVSRDNLRHDIEVAEHLANDPESMWRDRHRAEYDELIELLRQVDARGYIIDQSPKMRRRSRDPGHDYALANVYTHAAYFDRAEAERMLDAYLAQLDLHDCLYKWKRPTLFCWPMSIPPKPMNEVVIIDASA